jgi:hypothetical protein
MVNYMVTKQAFLVEGYEIHNLHVAYLYLFCPLFVHVTKQA